MLMMMSHGDIMSNGPWCSPCELDALHCGIPELDGTYVNYKSQYVLWSHNAHNYSHNALNPLDFYYTMSEQEN